MKITNILAIIQREFWENSGIMIKTPIVLCLILIALTCVGSYKTLTHSGDLFNFTFGDKNEHMQGMVAEHKKDKIKDNINSKKSAKIIPAFTLSAFFIGCILAGFYLIQSLYSDRKDKSILFWRSLPISEWEVVLAKYITGAWLIPTVFLILSLIGIVVSFIIIYLTSTVLGIDDWLTGIMAEIAGVSIVKTFTYVIRFYLLIFLLAPIYCWLLLASSLAKRNPLLIAIVTPISIIVIEAITLHSYHFLDTIKSFVNAQGYNAKYITTFDLAHIHSLSILVAIGLSAAFLWATVWLRNNRYEI